MAGTGVAYPADAVAGSPTFTSLNGRNAFAAAMAGATASKPLGGISGVRPGTPASTVTATSTTWTAQPFAGYVELEASGTNSGYFFAFGGVTTGAVTAAGGSARTDIVWVQIADPNTSDGSTGAPRMIIDYTANTTTPPARAFVIAQINVPASGGGAPTVTWVAPYTVAAGGILPVPAGSYPASPYMGQYVDDPTRGLLRYDGTAWGKPVPAAAYAQAAGTVSSAANTTGANAITFPASRFSQPPIVVVTLDGYAANAVALVTNVTASGCSINTYNVSTGANTSGVPFGWVAIQMTASSAAG